jgi:hypothetical protein
MVLRMLPVADDREAGASCMRCKRELLKIEPMMVAPKLCPKLREKTLALVTTPRCSQPTMDCMPTKEEVDNSPKPAPNKTWSMTNKYTGWGWGMNKKPMQAMKTKIVPNMEVSLKPMLRYNFPDREEATGHPKLMVARMNPDAIVPTPKEQKSSNGFSP